MANRRPGFALAGQERGREWNYFRERSLYNCQNYFAVTNKEAAPLLRNKAL